MFQSLVRRRLAAADIVPGRGRAGDPVITNPRAYRRIVLHGTLGLGESYMDGDWDCDAIDVFVHKALSAGTGLPAGSLHALAARFREPFRRAAHPAGAHELGERHYSIGNTFYEAMLGPSMVYTCAWWTQYAATLEAAQEAKLEMVCRKLHLKPGMTVLDIGCGWGSFLAHAAERYGITGVGITVSQAQAEYARKRCAGMDVDICLSDYRHFHGSFDRVVSLGMFEHVERAFHREFMQVFRRLMKDRGIGLLHTIGKDRATPPEPWIRKYIFPLGDIPTADRICRAADGLLREHHWHLLGSDQYDATLMAWHRNFERAWQAGLKEKLSDRFYRMWRFYLLACAGAFRARELDVWQVLYTRHEDDMSLEVPEF
jgi:cyclopropane-fatty-acyl-phospholipid synthase